MTKNRTAAIEPPALKKPVQRSDTNSNGPKTSRPTNATQQPKKTVSTPDPVQSNAPQTSNIKPVQRTDTSSSSRSLGVPDMPENQQPYAKAPPAIISDDEDEPDVSQDSESDVEPCLDLPSAVKEHIRSNLVWCLNQADAVEKQQIFVEGLLKKEHDKYKLLKAEKESWYSHLNGRIGALEKEKKNLKKILQKNGIEVN